MKKLVIPMIAMGVLAGSASGQSLITGRNVTYAFYGQYSGRFDIPLGGYSARHPGTDFTESASGPPGVFRRTDFRPTSIRIDYLATWSNVWTNNGNPADYWEYRDLYFGDPAWVIAGLNVTWGGTVLVDSTAPSNYPAFGPGTVTFVGNTVRVTHGGYRFLAGSWVEINMILVPGPGPAAFAAFGLIVAARRRRS